MNTPAKASLPVIKRLPKYYRYLRSLQADGTASGAFEAYASKGKRGGGIHVSCRGILLSSQY